MKRDRLLLLCLSVLDSLLIGIAAISPALAIVTIDPVARTVTTASGIFVGWDLTHGPNPEAIIDLQWKGLSYLNTTIQPGTANPWWGGGGDVEYFGNSWAITWPELQQVLVGAGQTEIKWDWPNDDHIEINSTGSAGYRVETTYKFFDNRNKFRVQRWFHFGTDHFAYDFRPYILRVSPRTSFYQVIYPDINHANLLTKNAQFYEFGVYEPNWDGTWFAIHDPVSGRGVVVIHDSAVDENNNTIQAQLWVDQDYGSFSDCSSVVLIQPPGGFTGTVTVVEFIGFYDATSWTPNLLTLPPGL